MHYQKVLDLNQRDVFALTGIGDCYRGKELNEQAIETWEKIIAAAPNNKYILGRLGDVHRKKKNWLDAITYYDRVLAIDKKDLYALTGLYCCCYFGLSNTAKAEEIEQRIAKIDPTKIILHMKLGDAFKHEHKLNEARECYQKVIATDPSNKTAIAKLQELNAL